MRGRKRQEYSERGTKSEKRKESVEERHRKRHYMDIDCVKVREQMINIDGQKRNKMSEWKK